MKTPTKTREARTAASRRTTRETADKLARVIASGRINPSGILRSLRELLSSEQALAKTPALRRYHD